MGSVVLSSLLLFAFCTGVRADDASLTALYDGRRWFDLRDAVAKGGTPVFYRPMSSSPGKSAYRKGGF
jgi:hypothetical protein